MNYNEEIQQLKDRIRQLESLIQLELKEQENKNVPVREEAVLPVDRENRILTSGLPVPEDNSHTKLREDGQQQAYVVLTASERSKGFVRPYRDAYKHVGPPGPTFPIRKLTKEEQKYYNESEDSWFEAYPDNHPSESTGKFWSQEELDKVGTGCQKITTMGRAIAETYSRDPYFYSGTFCLHCKKHFPVGEYGEFVWYEMDGSIGPRVGT